MGLKKLIGLIVGVAILAVAIISLSKIANHPTIGASRANLKMSLDVFFGNLTGSISPGRSTPISTLALEESLRTYVPLPFREFTEENWRWFWKLMYGRIEEDWGGWPKRKRQLTKIEVQDTLIGYYQRPFGSFGDQQWASFWQFVLKDRIFR